MVRWFDPSSGNKTSFLICMAAEDSSTTFASVSHCMETSSARNGECSCVGITYNHVTVLLSFVEAPDEETVGPLNEAVRQLHPVLGALLQDADEVAVTCKPQ